jgi:RNA polymerase sigma factor (sigma-70 family)
METNHDRRSTTMPEQLALNFQKIKDRDEAALRELFELLLPRLRYISRRYSGPRGYPDADELAQEALLKIYSHLDKAPMDDTQRFMSWCMVVARNVAVDYARKSQREEIQCERFDAEPRAAEMLTERTQLLLSEALSGLSQADRELLECRLKGTAMSEIAEMQNQSRASVYRRYSRILNELRKQLELETERTYGH